MTHDDALLALTMVGCIILYVNGVIHSVEGCKTWNKVVYAVALIVLFPPLFYVYNLALLG